MIPNRIVICVNVMYDKLNPTRNLHTQPTDRRTNALGKINNNDNKQNNKQTNKQTNEKKVTKLIQLLAHPPRFQRMALKTAWLLRKKDKC